MNLEIPHRQFTKEEINRCYLRWQQLRNEHGENARNVPEFVYFTKVLHVAAKQQQEQQQQQMQQREQVQRQGPSNGIQYQDPHRQAQQSVGTPQSRASPQVAQDLHGSLPQLQTMSQNRQGSMSMGQQQVAVESPLQQHISDNTRASNQGSPTVYGNQMVQERVQPQQQGQSRPQQSPAQAQSPSAHSGLSIFTIEQSELLKAQITSLKCLVNQQPVPTQSQAVIQQSIGTPPDFKRMLMALSDFVKRRKQVQNEQWNGPAEGNHQSDKAPPQHSPGLSQANSNTSPDQMQQNQLFQREQIQMIQRRHLQQQTALANNSIPPSSRLNGNNIVQESNLSNSHEIPMQRRSQQVDTNDFSKQQMAPGPNPTAKLEGQQSQPSAAIPAGETKNEEFKGEEKPPSPKPPVPLEEYKLLHPDVVKIIDVDNPDIMVDSFTLPQTANEFVDYEHLFSNGKSRRPTIQPGILPVGIDTHTATEIYQTLIALNLDTAVDDCLTNILNDEVDSNTKEDSLYDYYALQLLPLQKAVRGHLLQSVWYQNSLLTNTHPNFLSKIRCINVQDTLLTGELYKKHELLQYEKKRVEKSTKLEKVIDSSIHRHNKRLDYRTRRVKFGHKMINLHTMLEKEEQRRAERKAKERLQALKANDEEAYIKLLDQTKDTRITHLLKQTNAFLDSLTRAVKDQQDYT